MSPTLSQTPVIGAICKWYKNHKEKQALKNLPRPFLLQQYSSTKRASAWCVAQARARNASQTFKAKFKKSSFHYAHKDGKSVDGRVHMITASPSIWDRMALRLQEECANSTITIAKGDPEAYEVTPSVPCLQIYECEDVVVDDPNFFGESPSSPIPNDFNPKLDYLQVPAESWDEEEDDDDVDDQFEILYDDAVSTSNEFDSNDSILGDLTNSSGSSVVSEVLSVYRQVMEASESISLIAVTVSLESVSAYSEGSEINMDAPAAVPAIEIEECDDVIVDDVNFFSGSPRSPVVSVFNPMMDYLRPRPRPQVYCDDDKEVVVIDEDYEVPYEDVILVDYYADESVFEEVTALGSITTMAGSRCIACAPHCAKRLRSSSY